MRTKVYAETQPTTDAPGSPATGKRSVSAASAAALATTYNSPLRENLTEKRAQARNAACV